MNQLEGDQTESAPQENPTPNNQSRFPLTILAVSREEYYGQDAEHQPLQLTVRDAAGNPTELPPNLQGHVYIISPAGSITSPPVDPDRSDKVVWVSKDGWTPLYNGDGMIYCLSFIDGGATLKSRLAKPPCYYADVATIDPDKPYGDCVFTDLGLSRVSLNRLGIRNQVNTAFLPFKSDSDESDRLLLTWDVGRPYEIDPVTLELLTPVGKNEDWRGMLPRKYPLPFKQMMTSAHPAFDPQTNQIFTVNVGKSLGTMLALSRSLNERIADNAAKLKNPIDSSVLPPEIQKNISKIYSCLLTILKFVVGFIAQLENFYQRFADHNFVHILSWDGKKVEIGDRWKVILPNGRSLIINQTIHQMGITKDYLVFVETSFKFSLENILPYQKNKLANDLKILLADFLDAPQFPYSKLYIIKRKDLKPNLQPNNNWWSKILGNNQDNIPTVIAQEVELKPEFSHFIVDYDNQDNLITLHAAHLAAADIAEYIRIFDRSAFDNRDRRESGDLYDDPELTCRLQKLAGSVVSPMDVSRVGSWVINGETGKIVKYKLDSNRELTWSTAFYIYQDKKPTEKYTDIFWNSWGCWPDTLTARTVEAYEDYPLRQVSVSDVLRLTYDGVPSSLCHVKIERDPDSETITNIAIDGENFFKFDKHNLGTSSQFVPRPNAQNQTDGYVVCVVLTSDEFFSEPQPDDDPNWSKNSEIWIFDAQNLNNGPLYKLSHPRLNIGFSIHATWLENAVSPQKLDYKIKKDYDCLIEQQPKELKDRIQQLFDQEVYPHFPRYLSENGDKSNNRK